MTQKRRSRQTRPRAVFDTNILVSAILYGGTPRLCLEATRRGELELVTSRAILLEFANALREKFGWSEEDISEVIVGLGKFVTVVRPTVKINMIKDDLSDDKILEAAVEGKVGFIVSGDKRHILPLREFRGIKILTAAEFFKVL